MQIRKAQKKGFRPVVLSLRDFVGLQDHELLLDTNLPVLAGRIEDKSVDKWFSFREPRKNKKHFVHFYRGNVWLHEGRGDAR